MKTAFTGYTHKSYNIIDNLKFTNLGWSFNKPFLHLINQPWRVYQHKKDALAEYGRGNVMKITFYAESKQRCLLPAL